MLKKKNLKNKKNELNSYKTIIRPSKGWVSINFKEIWQYRELLYFLALRDIKLRYKQTALGAVWAIIQPLLIMVVFSLIFGKIAKLPSEDVPYPIFTFAALLPWQLFAYSINQSGSSLVMNQELITKVYFPRLIIPLSAVVSGLVDFGISFLVLLGMMFFYSIKISIVIVALPLFVLLSLLSAFAVGIWLSALNVRYRDIRYTIPFLTQVWLFVTPVAYSTSIISDKWRLIYSLNPMAGVVSGFRWALLGRPIESFVFIFLSFAVTSLIFIGGLYYFRSMEKTFADVI